MDLWEGLTQRRIFFGKMSAEWGGGDIHIIGVSVVRPICRDRRMKRPSVSVLTENLLLVGTKLGVWTLLLEYEVWVA